MNTAKRNFLKVANGKGDTSQKVLLISFTFLLIQISLTSIFLFLEPKLYVDFTGFPIKENIFLYLGIMAFIFIISLVIAVIYKPLQEK